MVSNLFQGIVEKVLLTIILGGLGIAWAWIQAKYHSKSVGLRRAVLISSLILVTVFCVLEAIWYVTSPTRFDIRMSQSDGGVGPWFSQDQTFGYMTISIVNTGSPTALRFWHLQLKDENGKVHEGELSFPAPPGAQPSQNDQLPIQGQAGGVPRVLLRSDFLPEKTARQVIGTGAEVDGFILAVFKDLPADFARNAKGKLIVTCEDARAEKYKLESYPLAPGQGMELKAIPGMGH
jgi:hypothetical protein